MRADFSRLAKPVEIYPNGPKEMIMNKGRAQVMALGLFFCLILSSAGPAMEYVRLVGGKLWVSIPKNLCLFHIIAMLTPTGEAMKDRFSHPLAQKAREYFVPYKNHAAVAAADQILKDMWYFPLNYLATFFTEFPEAKLREDIELPVELHNPEFRPLAFGFIEKAKDLYSVSRFEDFWQSQKAEFEKILSAAVKQFQEDIPSPADATIRYPHPDFPDLLESFFNARAERYEFVPCVFMPFSATHVEIQPKQGAPTYSYLQGGGLLPKPMYTCYFAIHEFSHSFLGPISEKYAREIDALNHLYLPLKSTFPSKGYETWAKAFDEHVNEAIQLWLVQKAFGEKDAEYFRTYELDKDFKLIDYFDESVREYDRHRDRYKDMDAFYPEILRRLSGLKAEPYRRPDRMGFDLDAQAGRILVKSVVPGMAFDRAGIRGGDIIVSVGQDAVFSMESFNQAKIKWWNSVKEGESCKLTILREGKKVELKVTVPFIDDYRYAEAKQ